MLHHDLAAQFFALTAKWSETRLEQANCEDGKAPPAHVERAFHRTFDCGILMNGFARAYCDCV